MGKQAEKSEPSQPVEQTAVLTTEHILATQNNAKVFVLEVDTSALANGETLELYVKSKCLSGGALAIAYSATYINVQAEPLKISVPIPSDIQAVFTLIQTGGTGRDYPWKVLSI